MTGESRKKAEEPEREEGEELSDLLRGTLNLFGIPIDLGKLLDSPEAIRERVEALRGRLQEAGAKEVLSEEAWRQGQASVSGYIRVRGLRGEEEFHIGTMGRPSRARQTAEPSTRQEDVMEPPTDVFDEGEETVVVADVPGIGLEDLEIKVEDDLLTLASKRGARRSYRKAVRLKAEADPQSVTAACRNGVLEVRVRKRGAGAG